MQGTECLLSCTSCSCVFCFFCFLSLPSLYLELLWLVCLMGEFGVGWSGFVLGCEL